MITFRKTAKGCVILHVIFIFTLGVCFCDKNPTSDEDSQSTVQITGVISLPEAAPGKALVVAVDENIDADDGFVKIYTSTCGEDTTINYTINEVPVGTHYIYAVVWVANPAYSTPQAGDFVGYYGTEGTIPDEPNAVVSTSGSTQFDIMLVVLP